MTTGIHYIKPVVMWPAQTVTKPEDGTIEDSFQIDITTKLYKFRFATRMDTARASKLSLVRLLFGGMVPIQETVPFESINNIWFGEEINPAHRISYMLRANERVAEPVVILFCAVIKPDKDYFTPTPLRSPLRTPPFDSKMHPCHDPYCQMP